MTLMFMHCRDSQCVMIKLYHVVQWNPSLVDTFGTAQRKYPHSGLVLYTPLINSVHVLATAHVAETMLKRCPCSRVALIERYHRTSTCTCTYLYPVAMLLLCCCYVLY